VLQIFPPHALLARFIIVFLRKDFSRASSLSVLFVVGTVLHKGTSPSGPHE
jgi:hypothetical protein